VHAYDPEILVMGGGVMTGGDVIVDYVQKYLDKHAWTDWGKVQVRAAQLGNNAALFGAVPLSSHPAKKTKAPPSAMHLTSLTTLFVFISSWDE